MKINIKDINAAVSLIGAASPILMTAFNLLKGIWLATNPGRTEDDYLNYLQRTSQANVDDTAVYLTAQGYVEIDGKWSKPTVG